MIVLILVVRDCVVLYRLYDVSLQQALPGDSRAVGAHTIELCTCPPTYTGLSCQVSSLLC